MSMSVRMPGPVPQKGQLVGCWFPYDNAPHAPGPKFRPVFVVAVNMHMLEDHPKIGLIYGTGQATTVKLGPVLMPHEFELNKGEGGNSLDEQTRFDCSRFVWLPFTVEWFKPSNGPVTMFRGFGKVPDGRLADVRAAVVAAGIKSNPVQPATPTPPVIVVKAAKVKLGDKTLTLPKAGSQAKKPPG